MGTALRMFKIKLFGRPPVGVQSSSMYHFTIPTSSTRCVGSKVPIFHGIAKLADHPTLVNQKISTGKGKSRQFSNKTITKSAKSISYSLQKNSWNRKHSSSFASAALLSHIFSMSASNITSHKWSSIKDGSVVETSWLAEQLKNPNSKVKVFDSSWTLQSGGQHTEYLQQHIPSALFFDIDKIADLTTTLPHNLPTAEDFAKHMVALGISNDDHIVLYDRGGQYVGNDIGNVVLKGAASARTWWTFKVFGHDKVSVLEGGLPKWIKDGYPVDSGTPDIKPSASYTPKFHAWMVESLDQMLVNIQQHKQIADARSLGRFQGVDPEPRPNLRGGHMPGSKCVPWSSVIYKQKEDDPYNVFLPPTELEQAFKKQGIDPKKPVITLCGSGVTAAVLSFGLHLLGNDNCSMYDSSWAEWGKESLADKTPVEKGK